MKQVTVNILSFTELEDTIQKKVLDRYRYIEVDDNNWYRFELEQFAELCNLFGIETTPEQIYFNGFYSQGSGSKFQAKIEVLQMLKAVEQESWKDDLNIDFHFKPCTVDARIIRQIEKGNIDCNFYTSTTNRSHSLVLHENHNYSYKGSLKIVESQLEILFDWVEQILNNLNRHLFQLLERTYEELTSDEAVTDFLTANDWAFTEDGRDANHLI